MVGVATSWGRAREDQHGMYSDPNTTSSCSHGQTWFVDQASIECICHNDSLQTASLRSASVVGFTISITTPDDIHSQAVQAYNKVQ